MTTYDTILSEVEEQEAVDNVNQVGGSKEPLVRSKSMSIDDQIDAHFLKYEKESMLEDDVADTALNELNMSRFLLEEEEAEEEDEAEKEDESKQPSLDVDTFTKNIARLLMNYDNLLFIEQAIVNRARQFLIKNYDEDAGLEFLESLENNFGLDYSESTREDVIDDPIAVGANQGGVGGMGG